MREPFTMPPGYDEWKTRSPDDYHPYDEEERCEHEYFSVSAETGSAQCSSCGEEWDATREQILLKWRGDVEYLESRLYSKSLLGRLQYRWYGSRLRRWLVLTPPMQRYYKRQFQRRFPPAVVNDDDIPF